MRIIGGRWKGRRLAVPPVPGLRPTPDRVRETLFNWLAPALPGARCLDLFAGSGALGLEALSRGAAEAVLVERHPAALRCLREAVDRLGARAEVVAADARTFLRRCREPFDLVFLDPPYGSRLLAPCLHLLAEGGWLRPGGWLYLEGAWAGAPEGPPLPAGYALHRRGHAGAVGYWLARRLDPGGGDDSGGTMG